MMDKQATESTLGGATADSQESLGLNNFNWQTEGLDQNRCWQLHRPRSLKSLETRKRQLDRRRLA